MCLGDDPHCAAIAGHRLRDRREMEPERRAFLATGGAAAMAAGGLPLMSPALTQVGAKVGAAKAAHYSPGELGVFRRRGPPRVIG